MQQTLVRLQIPNGVTFWPADFRAAVAAQNHVGPAFFGRDENKQTVANPAVRFVGGRGWVGLVADEQHESILFQHLGSVIDAATKHVGQPVPMEVERHELVLLRSTYPRFYRARQVALKRRSTEAQGADLADLLAKRIAQSLIRQADARGIDCPDPSVLEVSNIMVERELGMRLCTEHGPTGEYVTLIPSLTFSAFVELRGIWFIGNLSARGHGRVGPELRALPKVA